MCRFLSGGGLFSMINVGLIVLISSSYLGILEEQDYSNIQRILAGMSKNSAVFPAMRCRNRHFHVQLQPDTGLHAHL